MVKVSVIIPVFNGSLYLTECIRGVQEQTLQEIEVLCVDDGSADDSFRLLEQMRQSDPRIRVFRQKNRGTGSARNLALKNAVGEFVCFLDADDYFVSDDALEKLYDGAVRNSVSACGGQYYTDSGNGPERQDVYGKLRDGAERGEILAYADYQQDFYFSNYLYSRRMLQEEGIVFPAYRQFEDPPFCVRALSAAGRIYVTDTPFYCYRIGYKERVYDEEMACDQIRGMTDNLLFSARNGLERLHCVTYYRLRNSCRRELRAFCERQDGRAVQLLGEAERKVRWEWMPEKSGRLGHGLRESCSIQANGRGHASGEWVFPYGAVEDGSRVVIYGAGEVGRSYVRQIRDEKKVLLGAWVDGNACRIKEMEGAAVVPPEWLRDTDFDYVVIAAASMVTALEIMDILDSAGIAPEKVVWDTGR